jgi:predicted nucleotidyltransferase
MTLRDLVRSRRDEILRIAEKHGARNVRLFGSAARGDEQADSDIDVLVDMEPGRSLLDLGGLLMDLRACLGRDVDVVTENGLRPRIRERVLRDAINL